MKIYLIPALSDNYIFVLHQPQIAAVVDPAIAQPVIDLVNKLAANLIAIYNTHHHFDHVGGNLALLKKFPQLKICANAKERGRIPGQNCFLKVDSSDVVIKFGDRQAQVLSVPGHTLTHIAYYFPPLQPEGVGELFCGDTLFAGGCGRLFEGTAQQMFHSLAKLRNLPDNTRVWCAHEYTLTNLKFALTVEPNNQKLRQRYEQVKLLRAAGKPTIPSLLGLEKQTNPFLRWDSREVQNLLKISEPVQVFARLREMKDKF